MTTLGIDPGCSNGASSILLAGRVLWWCTWVRVSKGYRITYSDGSIVVPRLYGVGLLILEGARAHEVSRIILEGLIPKDLSSMVLAEGCGEMMAPVRASLKLPEDRPMAVERGSRRNLGWRRVVLNLPDSMGAQAAEEAAVSWAAKCCRWPEPSPVGRPTPLTMAELGALSESACMAHYRVGVAGVSVTMPIGGQ